MNRRPADNDIEIAILWLENNEGDEAESGACKRVAAWLLNEVEKRSEKRKDERIIRSLAYSTGSSVGRAREYWKRKKGGARDLGIGCVMLSRYGI